MDYISSDIVFTRDYINGYKFCNLGVEICRRLKDVDTEAASLPFIVEDMLAEIKREFTFKNKNGGKYLALENFNILFEPALGINVNMFIRNAVRGLCLILKTEHPALLEFFYPFPGNNSYFINLNNISLGVKLSNKFGS